MSGLAYELLWVRLLSLSFGSTTLSFSTVLAVFFGGLALGSFLAGRYLARVVRPVRAYATVEAGLAVLGLALYPVLTHLADVFARFDPGTGLSGALVRFVFAAPILLLPTVLMGSTLPLMCRALIHEDHEVGTQTALIYGINTLGAFLGAYGLTYVSLPHLGMFRSLLVTVGFNLTAAALAFWLSRREKPQPRGPRAERATVEKSKAHAFALVATFLSGLTFIGLEIIWSRLFAILLHGTLYGVGAVLISVLLGIGLGGVLAVPLLGRWERKGVDLGLAYAGIGVVGLVLTILQLTFVVSMAYVLASLTGWMGPGWASLHVQLLCVMLFLLPTTVLAGISFPVLIRRTESQAAGSGQAMAQVSAWNTLGSIAGSLIAGFFLLPHLGSETSLLFVFVGMALGAALAAVFLSQQKSRPLALGVALLSCLSLFGYRGFPALTLTQAGVTYGLDYSGFLNSLAAIEREKLFFQEGQSSNVLVRESGPNRSLTLNGLGQGSYSIDAPHHVFESLLVGFVPLAHVPSAKNALVVGLGAGTTVDYLLRAGVPRVTVLELEPGVIEASRRIFRGAGPAVDPRVTIEVNDARHYLRLNRLRSSTRFDVLTSMPAHPWVAAPIFTREFFELARENLAENGVFSTWFGDSNMPPEAVASLFRAFTSVFEHYMIYRIDEAGALFLVGSRAPLKLDPSRLAALQAMPDAREHRVLASPTFLARRVDATGEGRQEVSGLINDDDRSWVEVLAPLGNPSGKAPMEEGLLPHEYLRPENLAVANPRGALEMILEELLGSPRGRVSGLLVTPRAESAKRLLRSLSATLSPGARAYYEGRLALLDAQQRAEAVKSLERAARAGEARAQAWLERARLTPEEELIRDWPAHGPVAVDVWFEILNGVSVEEKTWTAQVKEALGRLDRKDLNGWEAREPLRWWVDKIASGSERLEEKDRAWLEAEFVPFLGFVPHRALMGICAAWAGRSGRSFLPLATACGEQETRLAGNRALAAMKEAARLVKEKKAGQAVALVQSALSWVPGHARILQATLEVGLRAGDAPLVERASRDLRLSGHSEEAVASWLRNLRKLIAEGPA